MSDTNIVPSVLPATPTTAGAFNLNPAGFNSATVPQQSPAQFPPPSGDFQIRHNGPPRHPTKPSSKLVWPDWFRKVWEITEQPMTEESQKKLNALFFDCIVRRNQERGSNAEQQTAVLPPHAGTKQSAGLPSRPVAASSGAQAIFSKAMRKPTLVNAVPTPAGSVAQKTSGKSSALQGAPKPKVAKTSAIAMPAKFAGQTEEINSTANFGIIPADPSAVIVSGETDAAPSSPTNSLLDDDLLGLTCCKCQTLDASDGNALLECSKCQKMYHQLCHDPPINYIDPRALFLCAKCRMS